MFEKAVREKVRFHYKGILTVEDLWDLHVAHLDAIYRALNAEVREKQEDSLLDTRSQQDELLDLQVEIVKHVVAVKLQEQAEHKGALERKARKQKLLAILEERQDADLLGQSTEELEEMIRELS